MNPPRERPAYVLPWIGVILASFAALPTVFGGRDVTGGSAVDGLGAAGEVLAADASSLPPQMAPLPSLGTDWDSVSVGAAQAAPEVASAASLTEFDLELESETLVGPPLLPTAERSAELEQPEEVRPTGLPQEPTRQPGLHRYQATPRLAADSTLPESRRANASAARFDRGSDAPQREASPSPSRARKLADGRTAVRLTPAVFTFLVGEGLLPPDAEIRSAIASDLSSEPVDAGLEQSPQEEREPTLVERRTRLKRLLVSNPARLAEFLAILSPGQLRKLVLELRGRGLSAERILGV